MRINPTSPMLQHLRRVLLNEGGTLTDGQLLSRYIEQRDEAAFAALVKRHGRLVWNVCRRLLGPTDTEDAFQATFLVLCCKAASIRRRERLASWLYGVAHQTALQARRALARRREQPVLKLPEPALREQEPGNDLRPLIDQELRRLPEDQQMVILLCDLEGRTRKEVARQLGCAEGTVASRLSRARASLARRLARHGLSWSGAVLAAMLSQNAASASVPAAVLSSTIRAASLLARGQAATGAISVKVLALKEGVLKSMRFSMGKLLSLLLALVALSGTAGWIYNTPAAEPSNGQVATPDKQKPKQKPRPDEQQLRGAWKLVEAEENGKRGRVEDEDVDATLTIKGETLHLKVARRSDGGPIDSGFFVFRLDPTTTPKLIDLADWHKGFEDNRAIIEGVYAIDGDTLTICFNNGAFGADAVVRNRPTSLRSKEGANTTVWILKRRPASR